MRPVSLVSLPSLIVSLFLSTPASYAGGVLTEDTLWSGTAVVDGSLEVPAGVTLRIEAGTVVLLRQSASLRVSGRLLAEGTENAPVRFTRYSAGITWGRLLFVEASDSLLGHCIVEFADSEGDHKDYYDDRDVDCNPRPDRPPRNYHEAVVVIASHLDIEGCIFQRLPGEGAAAEGDAIAVISDDPERPGEATANIRGCQFLSIGQGVHTRYSYVLVEECRFSGHRGDNDDVDLYGESTPAPLIRNNLFLNPDHDDMINPTRCSAVIIGNVIAGGDDHGIVLRDRCDPVVMNNVIYDCSSAGIAVQNSCDALLVNNTIVDCARGVRFFDHTTRWGLPYCLTPGSGRATLINCIIWNCPTSLELTDSPYQQDPGSHATLIHCDLQGSQAVSASSTVTLGAGNISMDPLFVDAASGNFHLQEGSPAVDAGTEEQAPDNDIDGKPRPCGKGVDIGASEFGDCGSPPVFRRGDANADGVTDISDPVLLLFHLFLQRELPCQKSADTDDMSGLDLGDVLSLLNYLFAGGNAPPAPGVSCGPDLTDDDLTCDSYGGCA